VLAPDSFATGMDWLLDRSVESCSIGVAFGQSSFTDLDFADDFYLLAELLELLVPILETILLYRHNISGMMQSDVWFLVSTASCFVL